MQMLYHIDPFYEGIVSISSFNNTNNTNNTNNKNNLKNRIVSLSRIFNAMLAGESPVDIRAEIEPLFCLGSTTPYSTQEDISEFINFCISPSLGSSIKEEVQTAYRSILNTIRETIILRDKSIEQKGKEEKRLFIVPQLLIDIPITREGVRIESLQDGINKEYGFPEKLLGDNLLRQTKNKNSSIVPAYVKHQYKTRDFMKTGEYVIFDFKRWIKTGTSTFRKDTHTVSIEKNITLQVNGASQNFGIQGIVFQSGGMGGGHYVYAWCSNPATNIWKTFNDSVVTEVRGFSGDMTVFESPVGDYNFSMQNAYVLVYQKGLIHDPSIGIAPVAQIPAYTYESSGMNATTYNAMVTMSPNQYAPRVKNANKTVKTLAERLAAAKTASRGAAPRVSASAPAPAAAAAPVLSKQSDPFAALDPFAEAPAAPAPAAPAPAAPAPAAPAPAAPAPAAPAPNNLLSFFTLPAAAAPAPAPKQNEWEKFEGGHRRKTQKTKRKARKQTRRRR